MPLDYVIDGERRLFRARMWGVITGAEITTIRQQLARDPRVTADFSELIDLRSVTSIEEITATDIRTLAVSEIEPVRRRAFVTMDPTTYGLARMFQSYRFIRRAREENQVFEKIEAAEAWLMSE